MAAASSSTSTTDSITLAMMSAATHNPLHNISHHIILKLTRDNYPLWKVVVVPFLEGHDLISFIYGTNLQPPKLTVDSTSGTMVPSPDFQTWHLQDKVLMRALITTLSDELLLHMMGILTSRSLWITLEMLFLSHSQTRLMQVRHQLATLKKGVKPIADYFRKAQGFAQLLAAIGLPLADSDVVSHILNGLGADYDPLVTSITTQSDPVSLSDLYGFLLSYELHLEQHAAAIYLSISTVNSAQRFSSSQHCSPPPRGTFNNSGTRNYYNNRGHGRGRGRGRGTPSYSSDYRHSSRPTCQFCHKIGHTAPNCWQCLDHSSAQNSPQAAAS